MPDVLRIIQKEASQDQKQKGDKTVLGFCININPSRPSPLLNVSLIWLYSPPTQRYVPSND